MGGSSQAWALELDAQFVEMEGGLRDAIIYIGVEALRRVKLKTPVDTGHAQNNWLLNVGSPDTGGTVSQAGVATDVFAARNADALANYPEGKYPAIYIQNNLPYILALEYGYSKQAPAGMVAVTVAELEALMAGMEI